MASTPKVSVIIPAYNQAHFLPDAVKSVLAQTFRDYEIIVVDDGSTDNTAEVAFQFGDAIRYVRQSNQGLAGARNTGIRHAQGEYLALLDCDDLWLPSFLEKMVFTAEGHPEADVFYCPVFIVDAENRELPQGPIGEPLSPGQMYSALLRANFLIPSTILMRRSAVEQAGLFDPAFRRLQDWELWLRLLKDGYRFVGYPQRLVRYRLHAGSLSNDPAGGQQAALAMVTKLFGADDGQWKTWTAEKRRAFGGAHRYHALTCVMQQHDWKECARYLRQALQVDPSLAFDLDLFYELALGDQPFGYRGTSQRLALQDNVLDLKSVLQEVFRYPLADDLLALRRKTWGTAYYALGTVAYNMGQLSMSRRYLIAALRFRPDLLVKRSITIPLLKSLVGASNLIRLRRLRRALKGEVV